MKRKKLKKFLTDEIEGSGIKFPDTREIVRKSIQAHSHPSQDKKNKQLQMGWKWLYKLAYSLGFCILFLVVSIYGIFFRDNPHLIYSNMVSKEAIILIQYGHIDMCYAFGNLEANKLPYLSLIKKNDALELSNNIKNETVSVYFGLKNGQDMFCFVEENPYTVYVYPSNLDYKGNDMLSYIERTLNVELNEKFLNAAKSGIFMKFDFFELLENNQRSWQATYYLFCDNYQKFDTSNKCSYIYNEDDFVVLTGWN